jgi:hypothetical protein
MKRFIAGAVALLLLATAAIGGPQHITASVLSTATSTWTDIAQRFSHIPNIVDDCGAPTDGVSDAGPAINTCLATYGRVAAPSGTFMIGTSIVPVAYGGLLGSTAGQTTMKLMPSHDGTDLVLCTNAYALFGAGDVTSNAGTTSASVAGGVATLALNQSETLPVGSTIVVAGITSTGGNPQGYNGTFVITASSAGSVSYADAAATGTQSVAGTVTITADGFELGNITFDGNYAAQAASNPAQTNGIVCYGQLWKWHDLIVQNTVGAAFHTGFQNSGGGGAYSVGLAHLSHLRIVNAQQDGWDWEGPHDSWLDHIDIENACQAADNTYFSFNATASNGTVDTIHTYLAGSSSNRCATQFYAPGGSFNIYNGYFEGGRQQVDLGQNSHFIGGHVFAQFPEGSATGTCQLTLQSNGIIVQGVQFNGWPTGSSQQRDMHGVCLGTSGAAASGNMLAGNSFWDYDVSGAIDYVNASAGSNQISGWGTTSGSGTSPMLVGTVPSTDDIYVVQGGTDPYSDTQIPNLPGQPTSYVTLTNGGTYSAGTEAVLWILTGVTGQTITLPSGVSNASTYSVCSKGESTGIAWAAPGGESTGGLIPSVIGNGQCLTWYYRLSTTVWQAQNGFDPASPLPIGATTPAAGSFTALTRGLEAVGSGAVSTATPGTSGSTISMPTATAVLNIRPAAAVTSVTITLPTPSADQTTLLIRVIGQPLNASSITWGGPGAASSVPTAIAANTSLTLWWDATSGKWTL